MKFLTLGCLYSFVFLFPYIFLIMIPPFFSLGLQFDDVLLNQKQAFECILGNLPLPDNCESGAMSAFLMYAFSGALLVIVQTYFVVEESAMFFSIVDSISTPATAIGFSIHAFVGDSAVPLDWSVWMSLVIIMVGVLIYKGDEIWLGCQTWYIGRSVKKRVLVISDKRGEIKYGEDDAASALCVLINL